MLLSVGTKVDVDWSDHQSGVTVFAIPTAEDYAKSHGMYRLHKEVCIVTQASDINE